MLRHYVCVKMTAKELYSAEGILVNNANFDQLTSLSFRVGMGTQLEFKAVGEEIYLCSECTLTGRLVPSPTKQIRKNAATCSIVNKTRNVEEN